MFTCIWSIASSEIGCAFVWPPGVGASRPNGLLNTAPSREKLLYCPFLPANDIPLYVDEAEGVRRRKSSSEREIVGNTFNCLLVILVEAPVLLLSNTLEPEETTTLASSFFLSCMVNSSVLFNPSSS